MLTLDVALQDTVVSVTVQNWRQGQLGKASRNATNKIAGSPCNIRAVGRFCLKLQRKAFAASCLLAAASIALAQPIPQAVNAPTPTPAPTAQALALGNKLVDIAWTIVNTIPLTDATAIYRQFGIKVFSVGFNENHINVVPAKREALLKSGLNSLWLTPFSRPRTTGAEEGKTDTGNSNESHFSMRLNQSEACVTIDRVKDVFEQKFEISQPSLSIVHCLDGGSSCRVVAPRVHEFPGISYRNTKFFGGDKGRISFSFEYQQCADTISISTRSPE